ncbi:nuclear factor 7, brain-like isoform X2 [Pristis pectinata]|uniref:nuclear factor 7, brain-like isoform X2 n=1 Tax=Pristis pectinata TaxID=685728 RepID=UPI00223D98C6|nr:nuclear factor 7, brain-like isoform X2 [Pristis pectinata]
MASRQEVKCLTEELICFICLDIFTDPVSLECDHSFCRRCITEYWEGKERNSCPVCREEFVRCVLRVNRALVSLSEKARKLNLDPIETKSKLYCEEHQEELKLFCETDKKLICVICRDAREHREHRFMPVKEAAEIYKAQTKSSIKSLTHYTSVIKEMEHEQKQKISGVRDQSCSLQTHITSEFSKMHRILIEKEKCLLRDLREEEERIVNRMEKNLRYIQENLNSMDQKLSALQKQMDQEDSVIFLKEEGRRKRRYSEKEYRLSVADDVLQVAKFDHPYLLNTALKEMFDAIKQVSVTVDVETAGSGLEVSEDLKSVRGTRTSKDPPNTRKRSVNGLGPATGIRSGARRLWSRNPADNSPAVNGNHLIPKFRIVKPQ